MSDMNTKLCSAGFYSGLGRSDGSNWTVIRQKVGHSLLDLSCLAHLPSVRGCIWTWGSMEGKGLHQRCWFITWVIGSDWREIQMNSPWQAHMQTRIWAHAHKLIPGLNRWQGKRTRAADKGVIKGWPVQEERWGDKPPDKHQSIVGNLTFISSRRMKEYEKEGQKLKQWGVSNKFLNGSISVLYCNQVLVPETQLFAPSLTQSIPFLILNCSKSAISETYTHAHRFCYVVGLFGVCLTCIRLCSLCSQAGGAGPPYTPHPCLSWSPDARLLLFILW